MLARASFGTRRSLSAPETPVPAAAPMIPPPRRIATLRFFEKITSNSLQHLSASLASAVASGADEVVLSLVSPGGDLLPTLELHRILLGLKAKLRTHAAGQVASAATLLYLAGSERTAHPAATFLFHQVSTPLQPPAGSFLSRSVERYRQLFELTAHEVYRTRTTLPHELIQRFAAGEIILDAKHALEFGVVDRICDLKPGEAASGLANPIDFVANG